MVPATFFFPATLMLCLDSVLYLVHCSAVSASRMHKKKIIARFYHTASGTSPVLDWFRSLPIDDRHTIGQDLARVEFRWPVGMPLCRSLGDGLWEVRSTLPSGRIARLIFCATAGELFVLHGLIKKTQKTQAADLTLARKRMKEVE